VNAARANVRPRGRHLPDRGQAADAHRWCRAGCFSSLSIDASDKLFGGAALRGRDPVASTCRIAAKRRDAGATGHNVRERGTNERRTRGGPCRIAAKRLTLTGGADRVSVRLPDPCGRHLPDCGQRLRRDAGATGHNARERGTGGRGDVGPHSDKPSNPKNTARGFWVKSASVVEPYDPAAMWVASTYRIAAKP